MNKAILTFDLEFWYNSNFLKKYLPQDQSTVKEDYIKESVEPILDLLNKTNQKATFFVLGKVAEKYPDLIKKIFDQGYEIASHGYSHKTLNDLDKEEFEKEIILSRRILEKITGQKIKGFRAPAFSLNNKTKWALEILKKYDFQYNSSSHPLSLKKNSGLITEIPVSLGGIYFRILPLKLYLTLVKYWPKPPVLYFHPYELFASAPQISSAPWFKRKLKYCGTKNAFKKFEILLNKFDFISIEEYLNEHENTSN